ncbi:hypothetical protein O3M35_005673 [Rhynocoris fuscipes]|uniref:Uncharacterized protein n=1 Tax=Rhynocoris fuscipes TaxID=488301 RepID=A0AAW1DPF1_9HEMI
MPKCNISVTETMEIGNPELQPTLGHQTKPRSPLAAKRSSISDRSAYTPKTNQQLRLLSPEVHGVSKYNFTCHSAGIEPVMA